MQRCCGRHRQPKWICQAPRGNTSRRRSEGDLMTALQALPKQALPQVLDRIDRDLQASLDRLFALLRIQSVSTDPAYAPHCRSAAEHVAADLRVLGFDTSVRPTAGHPVVE